MSANGLFVTRTAPAALPRTELAAFAAGCFWGVEEEFRRERGVVATAVGYEGGHTANPTYEEVCTGETGHAETVRVEFDPTVVTYAHLLDVFWNLHDPTTLNRQGPDHGEQYRSAIFFFNPAQRAAAVASRDRLQRSGTLNARIVTEITPAASFTAAESYHQQYVEKGGRAACHLRNRTPPNGVF
ncbi:MAG: peptide-methionine (S)-S-oxide reductase MsrA [Sandaracinaceae bacterium]|nr:peptide-methionine (S)-S-oxide reductase MsrA [Sandaracinaceae bacterium]